MSLIGITMGCPVGIGPEIIVKYFHTILQGKENSTPVIGDIGVLQQCCKLLNLPLECVPWHPGSPLEPGKISVLSVSNLQSSKLEWGKPTAYTGFAMADYISRGVSLVQDGYLGGLTTCPISKHAFLQAGVDFPGHTEMLASLTKSHKYAMMMAGKKLRITLVTIHCPMIEVAPQLTSKNVLDLIKTTHQALQTDFAISKPRIAVAGFNPHAGEQGMFGHEEQHFITPAIETAQSCGIDAKGPFPPDTIFFQAANGEYDAVVCMYHDQGLIPFKLLHFEDGVNVTLGLPIVRTSVDHGTAYDIAGKGIANPESLTAAIELAWTISKNRNKLLK